MESESKAEGVDGDEIFGAVLCAGYGTRFRPLTRALPKPLVPLLNVPLAAYPLQHLASTGIQTIGINTHHLAEKIPPVVDELAHTLGFRPTYTRESSIRGTGGGIRGIWAALGRPEGTLVVLNGDTIMELSLEAHLEAHRESGASITLITSDSTEGYGGVSVGDGGCVTRLTDWKHPSFDPGHADRTFTGVQLIDTEVIADIPEGEVGIVSDVYGPALENGAEIRARCQSGFWRSIENPELLMETSRRILDDPSTFTDSPLQEGQGGMYLHPDAEIGESVQIEPPVLADSGTRIRGEVELGPYAVLGGVEIEGRDLEISDAILYGTETIRNSRTEGVWIIDQSVGF